ncbi:MAG: serine hydrolase domain-containing protein [Fimbriimonas sp.]
MRALLLPALLLLPFAAQADAVDTYLEAEMKRLKIPGLTFGVIKDGKLVRTGAYGVVDLEHDVKTQKDDLFEIGSITKQFTAVATMMLVEQGKLSLDDPITKHLTDAPKAWEGVTLRHMLYQISGLPEYVAVPGLGLTDEFNRETYMKKMADQPLDFKTGSTWAYSNTNYALLGYVIEKVSGKSYVEFMTENVLKPVGMTNSRFSNPYDVVPRRAHGYLFNQGQVLRTLPMSASINSDGTLMCNVEDMAKWDAALRSGKLLSKASYDKLWAPAKLDTGRVRPYGMGFFLNSPKFPKFIGHHGNSAGYGAGHAHFPDQKLSVVVLANIYPAPGNQLAAGIAEILDPAVKFTAPKETTDPDPARTARVKGAVEKVAAGTVDPELHEVELTAAFQSARAKMFPSPYAPFRATKKFAFAGAEPVDGGTLLTYRVDTETRTFTLFVTYTAANKIANIVAKVDPLAPK